MNQAVYIICKLLLAGVISAAVMIFLCQPVNMTTQGELAVIKEEKNNLKVCDKCRMNSFVTVTSIFGLREEA